MNKSKKHSFTLIELMVVIFVIALLATIVGISVNNVRKKARDTKRLADIDALVKALDLYYDEHGQYPGNSDDDCKGWDLGLQDEPGGIDFISVLESDGFINHTPVDPKAKWAENPSDSNCGGSGPSGDGAGYHYFRYDAGSYACDTKLGPFYVLGVNDMETVKGLHQDTHPSSPGFSCPPNGRDWSSTNEWVIGKYE